jgi:hypothetical protein
MTYEHFKEKILQSLLGQLPEDTHVEIQEIIKNNNLHLDGLLISTPSVNISPTIYLNEYYRRYQEGETEEDFSAVVSSIMECYEEHRLKESIDTSFFTDYTKVRQHVVYKLINQEKNRQLLEDVPFLPFLDLAIVFCYYLSESQLSDRPQGTNGTILIRNSHLDYWNITVAELYHDAKRNTPVLMEAELQPLKNLCCELLPPAQQEEFLTEDWDSPLYVLTNQQRFLGAATILYHQILKRFAEELEDDLIILPSSIHEVLLVPAALVATPAILSGLVNEVNDTQVAAEEVLANHVYIYHRSTNEVCCG